MDRRQKRILVWLLTWAGLLVAVLYSPVGSPDLYSPTNYYSVNQGVSFKGVDFSNVPRSVNVGSRQDFSIPQTNQDVVHVTTTPTDASNSRTAAVQYSTGAQTTTTANRTGTGAAVGAIAVGSTRQSNSSGSTVTTTNGVASMNTDFTVLANKQQTNNYTPGAGATDPGDVPIGPPIPVGDGWIFLLLLAVGYAGWKKFRF